MNRAVIRVDMGNAADALADFRAAQAQAQRILGSNNAQLALMLAGSAEALIDIGRYAEGKGDAERALTIMSRFGTQDNLVVAFASYLMGEALLELGQRDEARPRLERAVKDFGNEGDVNGARVLFTLARALSNTPAERARAVTLACAAREKYARNNTFERRALVEDWLKSRGGSRRCERRDPRI